MCKTGLLACPKPIVILAIGLLSHTGIWALALLAVLTHITALERMFAVWQGTHKTPEVHDAATHNAHETSTDNHHLPTMAETNEAKKGQLSTAAHECTAVYRQSAARLKNITAYDKHKIEPDEKVERSLTAKPKREGWDGTAVLWHYSSTPHSASRP